MTLRLEIAEFKDADHWRWRLTDANEAFLADHVVALDRNEPRRQALFDLRAYLWQHSAPDKRDQDERRLLNEIGAWIGETVLGREIGEKILASGFPPITVRVIVPQAAERLLVMPLEIAHARGTPLADAGRQPGFRDAGCEAAGGCADRRPAAAACGVQPAAGRQPRSICAASGRCCVRLFAVSPDRRLSCAFSNMASLARLSVTSYAKERVGIFSIFPGHGLPGVAGIGETRRPTRPGFGLGSRELAAAEWQTAQAGHALVVSVGCRQHRADSLMVAHRDRAARMAPPKASQPPRKARSRNRRRRWRARSSRCSIARSSRCATPSKTSSRCFTHATSTMGYSGKDRTSPKRRRSPSTRHCPVRVRRGGAFDGDACAFRGESGRPAAHTAKAAAARRRFRGKDRGSHTFRLSRNTSLDASLP